MAFLHFEQVEKPQDLKRQEFVLMRPVIADDCRVVLFGAGHVGRALVWVLEPMADRNFGADGRQDVFTGSSVASATEDRGRA